MIIGSPIRSGEPRYTPNKHTRTPILPHCNRVWKAYGHKRRTRGRHTGTGSGPIRRRSAGGCPHKRTKPLKQEHFITKILQSEHAPARKRPACTTPPWPYPAVSTPVTADQVPSCRQLADLVFMVGDIAGRVEEHGDLFAPLPGTAGAKVESFRASARPPHTNKRSQAAGTDRRKP